MFNSIAIIQCTDKHTEVLGGLISLVGNNCKHLYIYYVPYPSDFVRYYINQHIVSTPIHSVKIKNEKDQKLNKEHDRYIFVTGMEYKGQTDPDKTLLLSHHTSQKTELKQWNTLGIFSISPVYNKVPYFMTFYEPNPKKISPSHHSTSKYLKLLFSGYTNPDNKDLKGLIRLLDYVKEENLPVRVDVVNYYPIEELDEYYPVCKVHVDMSAQKMMKLMTEADYVLTLAKKNSSYHRNQLSGIIPLSISIGTPLLIDEDLAAIYDFSSSNFLIYNYSGPNTIKNTIINLLETPNYKKIRQNKAKSLLRYRDKMIKVYQKKMKAFLH